jgi:hypothetical protein
MEEKSHISPAPFDFIDDDLVGFFDLLARFDFEDKKRSGINPGSPDPVPGGSGFASDTQQND